MITRTFVKYEEILLILVTLIYELSFIPQIHKIDVCV